MKKKTGIIIISIILLLLQTVTVYGDVIFEPEDSFYEKHAEECEYVNRSYVVNGYGGEADVYENPLSAKVQTTLKNGDTCYISFVYTDSKKNEWGFVEADRSGWVPMVYMYPVYNSLSFQEEYADMLKEESGSIPGEQSVYAWDYPGAEESYTLEIVKDSPLNYSTVFTDEEGLHWANMGYYMGYRDFWVCLDDPANPDLPVRQVDREMPEPPETIERVNASSFMIWPVAFLIVLVIGISWFLIWKFYGKK